jgi:uncharacterized membrane-anchored protein
MTLTPLRSWFATLKPSWIAIAAVAAIQTLALVYIVFDRVSLLASGREIVAEVIPVDPRDIFRGDYVVLNYTFTRTGDVPVPESTRTGDKLYVTLKPGAEPNTWEIVSADTSYPASVASENVVLKGLANYVSAKTDTQPATANVRYGIESYFIPEGTGKELEELVRDKKIAAVIAVGSNGEAAIKALVIDGKRVVEEPLL